MPCSSLLLSSFGPSSAYWVSRATFLYSIEPYIYLRLCEVEKQNDRYRSEDRHCRLQSKYSSTALRSCVTKHHDQIATGVVLGFTLVLALGRVFIKFHKFRRLFIDDGLFIAAAILLVSGTITVSLTLPYNQTEVNVGAGIEAPPPDLMHQLDMDVKLQDASCFLINASVFAVKFSFLFFFRLLLQRTGKLQTWWWSVFIFTIPCAVICMCTEFMVCPAFGDRILGEQPRTAFFCPVTDPTPC